MRPYIVKFIHSDEQVDGTYVSQEMYLCLSATDKRDAFERYLQVTGGEQRQNMIVSVTGKDKIEAFWSREHWSFFTIPTD
jgi:hypothetical protein